MDRNHCPRSIGIPVRNRRNPQAVNVTGVKEPQKTVVGAVQRTADESGNMGRTQKAVPRKLAHDCHVVVREAEGWRLRRTAEPRPTGRGDKRLHVHANNYTGPHLSTWARRMGKGSATKVQSALLHVGRRDASFGRPFCFGTRKARCAGDDAGPKASTEPAVTGTRGGESAARHPSNTRDIAGLSGFLSPLIHARTPEVPRSLSRIVIKRVSDVCRNPGVIVH